MRRSARARAPTTPVRARAVSATISGTGFATPGARVLSTFEHGNVDQVASSTETVEALRRMMARFKGSPVDTVGYYAAIGRAVGERLGHAHPLARELAVIHARCVFAGGRGATHDTVLTRVGEGGPVRECV